MSFPILEFDPAPEAFYEAPRVIRARDLPEHCVITFFQEVIEKVIAEHGARVARVPAARRRRREGRRYHQRRRDRGPARSLQGVTRP